MQRRLLPAGLLRQQVARSVAVMAMAPLLSEGVPEHQAEGAPIGKYEKLKVGRTAGSCLVLPIDTMSKQD